jgi:hypothetical protein
MRLLQAATFILLFAAVVGCECKTTGEIKITNMAPAHAVGDVVSVRAETADCLPSSPYRLLNRSPRPAESSCRNGVVLKVRRSDSEMHAWDYRVLFVGGEEIWHKGPMTSVPNPGIDEFHRQVVSSRLASIEADMAAVRAKVVPHDEPPAPDAPPPPAPAP